MKFDTQYFCMNKDCGTVIVGVGKIIDGLNCPRCNGPVYPQLFKPYKEVTLAVYECLCCGHSSRVTGKKEDYSEVKVCPKCNGAFVDKYKIAKYKQYIQHEIKEKLLVIELDSIDSVPRVMFKGEEIKSKIRVSFDWKTNGEGVHPSYLKLKYFDPKSKQADTITTQYNSPLGINNA